MHTPEVCVHAEARFEEDLRFVANFTPSQIVVKASDKELFKVSTTEMR